MRVVALISGGKDSLYNALLTQAEGHEIVALANLHPKDKDELDSYMYQTVGHQGIEKIAEAMELPLYRKETNGNSLQKGKSYEPTDNDEVEDLYELLKEIKENENVSGVACGAILSDYQRVRVENVCQRLQLVSLTYLWRRNQKDLLEEMIDCKIDAILIKVAALGLLPNHLGKSISDLKSHLFCMHDKYKLNICGEGGEYETFVLQCPLYKKSIVIEDMQIVLSSADPICPVGYINFTKLRHDTKTTSSKFKVKTSKDFVQIDCKSNENIDETQKDIFPVKETLPCALIMDNEKSQPLLFIQNIPQIVINRKGWIFLTGVQCNDTDPSIAIVKGLRQMEEMLKLHNYSLNDILNVVLYINDMNNFGTINSAYLTVIDFQNPPTRICVECEMPKNCTLIMEAIAHKPKQINSDDFFKKTVLHVQSISHWAPANIGPYSQSIKIGNITYVSGQIGLIPGNLEIIEGGIYAQTKLVLRHISRITEVMNVNGKLRDVLQGICYVKNKNDIPIARKLWESQSTNAIIDYIVVKNLPRNALIEFQVWTHLGNDKFEYEETGCAFDGLTVLLKRRWNYESECSAGICTISASTKKEYVDTSAITPNDIMQVLEYFILKMCPELAHPPNNEKPMQNSLFIRIFYDIKNTPPFLRDVIDEIKDKRSDVQLAFTIVPVCGFQSNNDFMSFNGIRHE